MKKILMVVAAVLVVSGAIAYHVDQAERAIALAVGVPVKAHYVTTADATGAGVTLWSTDTGERWTIGSMFVCCATPMDVTFYDQTVAMFTAYLGATDGAVPFFAPPIRSALQGNDLIVKASLAGNLSIIMTGDSEWD